jgi:hypothetical protein
MSVFGIDLFGDEIRGSSESMLGGRFGMPPFSVLDAKGGAWRERKAAWMSLGIKSEEGRGCNLAYETSALQGYNGTAKEDASEGTSIFDPVLCELAYRWFCPKDGQVIDPFAGGSVRGIVASMLDRRYWGCDLSAVQVRANETQRDSLLNQPSHDPTWVIGDARDALKDAPLADLMFTCPPYGTLERYSDDERDLSTMRWAEFVQPYREIILRGADRLRDDSWACVVVGNFREGDSLCDLAGETIRAFECAGMSYHNEALLLTPIGTAMMRASAQFDVKRKLCKVHQNVLVFCKGDPRRATEKIL